MKKEFVCFWCWMRYDTLCEGDEFYHHPQMDLCEYHYLKCKPSIQKLFLKIKTNQTTLHGNVWCDGPICKMWGEVTEPVFKGLLSDAKSGKKMSKEFEDIYEFIFEDGNINDIKDVNVDDTNHYDVMGELLHEQFYPVEMHMDGIVGTRHKYGRKDYCEKCIKLVDVKNPEVITDGDKIYHSSFDIVE